MEAKAKFSQFCLLYSNLYCEVVYEAEVLLYLLGLAWYLPKIYLDIYLRQHN